MPSFVQKQDDHDKANPIVDNRQFSMPGRSDFDQGGASQEGNSQFYTQDDSSLGSRQDLKNQEIEGIKGFGNDSSTDIAKQSAFRRRGDVNIYAEQVGDRFKMDRRRRNCIILLILLIITLPLVMVLPYDIMNNVHGVSLALIVSSLQSNARDFINLFIDPSMAGSHQYVVAKYLLVAFAGAGLGITGAVYQGAFKNSLASPSTLGVTTGATLGGTLYLVFGGEVFTSSFVMTSSSLNDVLSEMSFPEIAWMLYGKSLWMLIGSGIVVGAVLLMSRICSRGGSNSGLWLILAGQIVGSACGSITGLIQSYYRETDETMATEIQNLSMEAFGDTYNFLDVAIVAVPVTVCLVVVLAWRSRIGALAFGDEEAKAMGINASLMRVSVIAVTTIMMAIITAFCGSIGYLGFIVPHITRRIIGPDFRYLLPASALLGSLSLLIIYYVLSFIGTDIASYIGLFISVVGFVSFIVLLIAQRRNRGFNG